MHILKLFIAFAFVFSCLNAGAAEVVDQPDTDFIHIASETLEIDQQAGLAIFEGKVAISYIDLSLESDRLNIVYAKNTENVMETEGQKTSDISRILAYGNVVLTQESAKVTAEKAVYLPHNHTLTLTGNVVLLRDGTELSGNKLTYDTLTKNMKLDAAPASGRVKASFALGGKAKSGK